MLTQIFKNISTKPPAPLPSIRAPLPSSKNFFSQNLKVSQRHSNFSENATQIQDAISGPNKENNKES